MDNISVDQQCDRDINSGPASVLPKACDISSDPFICGVVEGFYGQPWTFAQRKDLFKRLRELRLNSFLYAPKDDTKHRAKWRELYTEFEACELKGLIDEAAANGIDFYYSLAPGLDMHYSRDDDHQVLLQKFNQIKSLGCKSFALLFDDIEPNLSNESDRKCFGNNYAAAQTFVTNIIFNKLQKPKFLFCPTEYCESRAVPNVMDSLYLKTLGTDLPEQISIMWSGSRVVSRVITEDSIKQLNKVIRRPALIWENLHANDYDKKRVYLGPYSGRSTRIIPHLRGVLTNPNCEYEANYIAIHTLAQWRMCNSDANPNNTCDQERQQNSPTRSTTLMNAPINFSDNQDKHTDTVVVYNPESALTRAIHDWLPHVLSTRSLPQGINHIIGEQHHLRNDQLASEQLSKEENIIACDDSESSLQQNIQIEEADMRDATDDDSIDQDKSLVDKSDMDTTPSSPLVMPAESCDSCDMQDASDEQTSSSKPQNLLVARDACPNASDQLSKDGTNQSANSVAVSQDKLNQSVNIDSLALLIDFFYLPFEHGNRGHAFLCDIKWLVDHSGVLLTCACSKDRVTHNGGAEGDADLAMKDDADNDDDAVVEAQPLNTDASELKSFVDNKDEEKLAELWMNRADKLNGTCSYINSIVSTFIHDCPNKLVTIELYPYLAELRDAIHVLTNYIDFLRYRKSNTDHFHFSTTGLKRNKEDVPIDEQEPWVHRGGLIGDIRRLIA